MFFFSRDKIRINMVIPIFWGSKGEDPEMFLKEYKRACIGTGLRTATEWLNFLPEFLEGTASLWFKQQTEDLKGSWIDITKALVKEFFVKNVYQNLILELSQLKQGPLESIREYKDRIMTLQNKLQGLGHKVMKELIQFLWESMHWY